MPSPLLVQFRTSVSTLLAPTELFQTAATLRLSIVSRTILSPMTSISHTPSSMESCVMTISTDGTSTYSPRRTVLSRAPLRLNIRPSFKTELPLSCLTTNGESATQSLEISGLLLPAQKSALLLPQVSSSTPDSSSITTAPSSTTSTSSSQPGVEAVLRSSAHSPSPWLLDSLPSPSDHDMPYLFFHNNIFVINIRTLINSKYLFIYIPSAVLISAK